MKCVKLLQTGEIYRVTDVMARVAVEIGQAVYSTKDAWKKAGRKTTKSLNQKGESNGETSSVKENQ